MMPIQTTVPSLPRACAARQDGCGGTFCAEGGRDRLHCLHEAKSPGEIVPWGKMSRGEHSALRQCLAGRPGRTPLEHMYNVLANFLMTSFITKAYCLHRAPCVACPIDGFCSHSSRSWWFSCWLLSWRVLSSSPRVAGRCSPPSSTWRDCCRWRKIY